MPRKDYKKPNSKEKIIHFRVTAGQYDALKKRGTPNLEARKIVLEEIEKW